MTLRITAKQLNLLRRYLKQVNPTADERTFIKTAIWYKTGRYELTLGEFLNRPPLIGFTSHENIRKYFKLKGPFPSDDGDLAYYVELTDIRPVDNQPVMAKVHASQGPWLSQQWGERLSNDYLMAPEVPGVLVSETPKPEIER